MDHISERSVYDRIFDCEPSDPLCSPCPPGCCGAEGPLGVCTEFISICSVCSRVASCPLAMQPNWACATGDGDDSSLRVVQSIQIVLESSYRDSSAVKVHLLDEWPRTSCEDLRVYDAFCVLVGVQTLGPFPFGCGFPIPPVTRARHFVIVPCRREYGSTTFCESFACVLSIASRSSIPESMLQCDEPTHTLHICGSIPWKCTLSETTWEQVVHREKNVRCSCANLLARPAWAACHHGWLGPQARYNGSLLGLGEKTGLCDIWINDTSCVGIPLTSSYVVLPHLKHVGGGGCQADVDTYICTTLPGSSGVPSSPILDCVVDWTGDLSECFKSIPTHCRVCVRGTGVLDGTRLLTAWGSQVCPLNAIVPGKATLGQVLRRAQYEIVSGLLEIDAIGSREGSPAITVNGPQILSPPKRYRSAVQLNGFNATRSDSSSPGGRVHVRDLKVIGGWVEASDGPETLATGSHFTLCCYHIASDAVKIGAGGLRYEGVTLLQGNAGGCINIGCDGKIPAAIADIGVCGIYVQRVCQSTAQSDGVGGLIVSRNACTGGSVECCTISDLHVPFLGGSSVVASDDAQEVPLKGPNMYWRVSAIGYALSSQDSHHPTTMTRIDLLRIAPRMMPLGAEDTWFLYYRIAPASTTTVERAYAKLGQMRLTLPPGENARKTRQIYENSACRIYTFPQDPLRTDYFVCANVLIPIVGVDSLWLKHRTGFDIPRNVSFLDIIPTGVVTPLRFLTK